MVGAVKAALSTLVKENTSESIVERMSYLRIRSISIGIKGFWGFAKARLAKYFGMPPHSFSLHL